MKLTATLLVQILIAHDDFQLPIINESMKMAEADPFKMMHQTDNDTCSIEYSGPTNVLISSQQNCIYSINVKTTDIVLAPSQPCKPSPTTINNSKYFSVGTCHPRHQNNAWDCIQIKNHYNQNYIYCFGNNVTIGGVTDPCPNTTFVLHQSTETTFTTKVLLCICTYFFRYSAFICYSSNME